MLTELSIGIQGLTQATIGKIQRVKSYVNSIDAKVNFFGRILGHAKPNTSANQQSSRNYSSSRVICIASLLLSVRGQRSAPFPAQFDLSSLDGTNGFILRGEASGDNSGYSASFAGDVNGDGIEDLVIGAFNAAHASRPRTGKSYVVFGSRSLSSILNSGGTLKLSSLNGTNGFSLIGEAKGDHSGRSVSSGGDVNGDGIADLIIGAYFATPSGRTRAGKSYVVFGRSSIGSLVDSDGSLELSSLNGNNGFILNGEAADDQSGNSVSGAGDVNGDGFADLVIGASGAAPLGRLLAGKSYVVFGRRSFSYLVGSGGMLELSSLNGSNGFILNGEAASDSSGYSVSSAGDVNGDGLADIMIGAWGADPSGRSSAGKCYVVFGSRNISRLVGTGGSLELSSLNGNNGFILKGEEVNDRSGSSVSSAGDVNGDALADIVIGAWHTDPSGRSYAGRSYVVLGSRSISSLVGSDGTFELSSLNGSNGFILNGEVADDRSGSLVSSVGDVNGDGLSDFVIGAYDADPHGRSSAGKSYVIFGTRNISSLVGSGSTFELSSLDGSNGFILNGEAASDFSGRSVSSAGDVNGDGVSDILVGASGASPQGKSNAGLTYVIYGRKLSLAGSTLSTLATSSLLFSSSLSLTSIGQKQSTVSTSIHTSSRLTTISHSTILFNSLVHTTSSNQLTSDTQSLVLPIVLAGSGVFCLSGIVVVVIVFRKCKNPDKETGQNFNQTEPVAHTVKSNGNYEMITLMPKYDSCDLKADEYDSVRSVPLESNTKKSPQNDYIEILLPD